MVSEEARLTGVLGPGESLMDINACAACACAVGNAFASVDASGGIGSEWEVPGGEVGIKFCSPPHTDSTRGISGGSWECRCWWSWETTRRGDCWTMSGLATEDVLFTTSGTPRTDTGLSGKCPSSTAASSTLSTLSCGDNFTWCEVVASMSWDSSKSWPSMSSVGVVDFGLVESEERNELMDVVVIIEEEFDSSPWEMLFSRAFVAATGKLAAMFWRTLLTKRSLVRIIRLSVKRQGKIREKSNFVIFLRNQLTYQLPKLQMIYNLDKVTYLVAIVLICKKLIKGDRHENRIQNIHIETKPQTHLSKQSRVEKEVRQWWFHRRVDRWGCEDQLLTRAASCRHFEDYPWGHSRIRRLNYPWSNTLARARTKFSKK